jgi:hypothetical protein
MGVVGLRAACLLVHKLAGAKHLWGPVIIICHMHGMAGLEHLKRSEFRKTGPEKGALWRAEYGAVKRDVRYNRLTFYRGNAALC